MRRALGVVAAMSAIGSIGVLGGGVAAAIVAGDRPAVPVPPASEPASTPSPPTTCAPPPAAAPAGDAGPGAVVVTFVVPDCR